jgi:hypothetical protein
MPAGDYAALSAPDCSGNEQIPAPIAARPPATPT